jgi:glycosyltransferase involved in cell wall biosynthesis
MISSQKCPATRALTPTGLTENWLRTSDPTVGREKSPLRVLFMIDHLGGLGGGETSLVRIVRSMPPDRVRCSVVTLDDRVNPVLKRQLTCPLHVFRLRSAFDLHAFRVAGEIRRLLRTEKIDLVHTFFESSNLWGGVVCKLGGGPRLVSSRRDMNILRNRGMHRLGYAIVNRICDRVLTVSDAVRDLCINQEQLAPEKVVTLHNGIDLEQISQIPPDSQLREKLQFAPADPIIACVANVRRVKGLDVLVKVAGIVCREIPNARFLVVGGENEPDYGIELRATVRQMGLEDKFIFLGLAPQVISILKASQIFCLLSRTEGFSNALLEAMGCSLPSVVTRVGGNAEAIEDGKSGFVVNSEDVAAAAHRVLGLLRNPQLCATMGLAAYQSVVSQFSSSQMISNLASFYEQVVRGEAAC